MINKVNTQNQPVHQAKGQFKMLICEHSSIQYIIKLWSEFVYYIPPTPHTHSIKIEKCHVKWDILTYSTVSELKCIME